MEKKEIKDILISWITISFAFSWIGLQIFSPKGMIEFTINFLIIAIAVGSGFILHELAHRYIAINFGAKAKYIAWKEGLLLAVALAIITNGTFVFAAPGAVYVYGKKILTKQNGIISIAGPVTNILVALAASIIGILLSPTGLILTIIKSTIMVNFFLAAFNLIPIGPLDGKKVFLWSKTAWTITILTAISGVILNEQYFQIIGLA